MKKDLCPFCNSADLDVCSNGIDQYSVICNNCGAEGPTAEDEDDAYVMWNERTQ